MNFLAPQRVSRSRKSLRRRIADLLPAHGMEAIYYDFHSEWHIEGTVQEVAEILSDPLSCADWWQASFLRIEQLESGDANHVGCVVRFISKGYLPYLEQVLFKVVEAEPMRGFTVRAAGDFHGWAACEVHQSARGKVHVISDWVIEVKDPFLRVLSPIARPLFASNHRWVMMAGEKGLQREIYRRQGRQDLRPAPRPFFPYNLPRLLESLRWKPWTETWENAEARASVDQE